MIVSIVYQKPCPDGWVRFFDLNVPLLVLFAILLVVAIVVAVCVRGSRPHYVTGTLAVIVSAGVVVLLVPAVATAWEAIIDRGYAAGCWTF